MYIERGESMNIIGKTSCEQWQFSCMNGSGNSGSVSVNFLKRLYRDYSRFRFERNAPYDIVIFAQLFRTFCILYVTVRTMQFYTFQYVVDP